MTTGKCSCGFAFGRGDLLSAFLAVTEYIGKYLIKALENDTR